MTTNPYLSFNGNCNEAFAFYEKALGGKILFKMTYGDTPCAEETSKELANRIAHVRMDVKGVLLMGSDAPPERYQKPQGFHLNLNVTTVDEAESLFKTMSEGGTITMPIEETFWALRFDMLVDRFGTPWMVNCEKPMA